MSLPSVFGDYVLLKALGKGATGDVLLARSRAPRTGLPKVVVIKRLHGELAQRELFVRRFHHEAQIAVSIDSPHVAKVFDAGRVDDVLYIAMELIEGWPLSRVIEQLRIEARSMTVADAVEIISGALNGLHALHTAKDARGRAIEFVHRDIAPKNLMVGRDGKTRLIDLGLGKSRVQDWKTATGSIMGTPGYMAPEQVFAEGVDARTDLYAVGIILFELLTNRSFIERGALTDMLRASVAPQYPPPSSVRGELPKVIDRLVARALAPDPEARFQSAAEFLTALYAALPSSAPAREPIRTLVGGPLWMELDSSSGDVARLIETPVPDTEVTARRTLIYAQRAEVQRSAKSDYAPTLVREPAPREPPLRDTAVRKRGRISISPATFAVALGAMFALGGAVAVAIAVGLSRSAAIAPKEAIAPIESADRAPAPQVMERAPPPGEVQRAEESEATAAEAQLAEEASGAAEGPRPLRRPARPVRAAEERRPATANGAGDLEALLARARALGAHLPKGSAEADAARQLIIDANTELAADARDAGRIRALRERLDQLEALPRE